MLEKIFDNNMTNNISKIKKILEIYLPYELIYKYNGFIESNTNIIVKDFLSLISKKINHNNIIFIKPINKCLCGNITYNVIFEDGCWFGIRKCNCDNEIFI